MEQSITIELFGQKSKYATDIEVSEAYKIADLLIKEVAKVEGQMKKKCNNISILTIASLNIIEEYLSLKNKHNDLLFKISESSTELLKKLDEHKKL